MLAFLQGLSPLHLLVVAIVALLLFGNRLPDVARSLGKAVNEFKRGLKDVQDEISRDDSKSGGDGPPPKLSPPTESQRLDDGSADHPAPDNTATAHNDRVESPDQAKR
jgi:sec-independent protein translocase protein TatA